MNLVFLSQKATVADLKRKHGDGQEGVGGKKARQLSPREKVVRFNCAYQHLPYSEQVGGHS